MYLITAYARHPQTGRDYAVATQRTERADHAAFLQELFADRYGSASITKENE